MSELQPHGQGYQAPVPAQPYAPQPHGPVPGWQPGHGVLTDRRDVGTGVVVVAWLLAVVTATYMLPWAIAATRGKANHGSIAVLNVFLGWSLIGWVVALVMACQPHQVVAGGAAVNVVFAQQFPNAQFTGPVPPVHTGPAAGWYPAPDGVGRQYWDGAVWTEHRAY